MYNRYQEAIKFLNTKARDFYKSDSTILSVADKNRFKAAFLTGIIDFERVIRGTFGSHIDLRDVDVGKLKQMFPNACNNIFNIKDDISFMGDVVENLRNINAHAFLSTEDEAIFDYDYSSLKTVKSLCGDVIFLDGNDVTVAGLVYILLNLLREESIKMLTHKDYTFSVVAEGKYSICDGATFVSEVSKTNLEIDIRDDKPTTVVDSVLGNSKEKSVFMEESVAFIQGNPSTPTIKIQCIYLTEDTILVAKGTLTRTLYKRDYRLDIKEPGLFVEISNKVPPFALVDYLYLKDIHVFDKETYDALSNDNLLLKLNKPKFYVDKNIKLLTLTEESADYRLVSSMISDGLTALFMSLEEFIYTQYGLIENDSYSSLRKALNNCDIDDHLREKVIALRNIVAHGFMFGDYIYLGNTLAEYTLNYVLNTLNKLTRKLNVYGKDIYEFITPRIASLIIRRSIDTKYKKMDEVAMRYFRSNGTDVSPDIAQKHLAIARSIYDTNIYLIYHGLVILIIGLLKLISPPLNFRFMFWQTK